MTITRLICSGAFIGLSACGGGGGNGDGGDNADTVSLFFGSRESTASATGLPFATADDVITDVNGQTLQVRLVRFVSDNQTGATRFEISDETVTFADIVGEDLTITFGGEEITFVAGEGTRDKGIEIEAFAGLGNDEVFGQFSSLVSIYSYAAEHEGFEDGENTDGVFAIGFETNPDTIQAQTGQAFYSSAFDGFGLLFDGDGALDEEESRFTGGITLVADFNSDSVSGNASIAFDDIDDLDVDLAIAPTDITGNGFEGALDIAGCTDGFTCTSASQIAGVFYGPNGEELTGVSALDLKLTNAEGEESQYIATGGFIGQSMN